MIDVTIRIVQRCAARAPANTARADTIVVAVSMVVKVFILPLPNSRGDVQDTERSSK